MAKKRRRQDDQMFLNSILDNIPAMVFVKDARSLRFVRLNKLGQELLGHKESELIGKNDYNFFPKKEADFFTRKDRAVLRSKTLLDIAEEPIHTRKRGIRILHTKKIPLLDSFGRSQYLLGISEDITERCNAENALRKAYEELEDRVQERTAELSQINDALRDSEERYRRVVGALLEGVLVVDARGKIISANNGAEKILGFSSSDLVGESIADQAWDVLKEDGRKNTQKHFLMARSLKTGKSFANIITGLKRADGKLLWLNANTQPLFRPGEKKPYAVVTSFFDITHRKEMQAEIQKLNTDLEQKVERRTAELKAVVSELESFSYSVSHDLRAPLRAINGFSEMLLENHASALNDEGRQLLGVVRKNTLQMSQLIDDLLTFAHIARKDLAKKRVPMTELVQEIATELQGELPQAPCRLTINPLADADGDAALLRQVWTNLLSNALKFSRTRPDPEIEVTCSKMPKELIYCVRDNGVGFDMQYVHKLFGVFQRLHSNLEFEGTGVGLAIVQRIVLKHAGRVWAEGEVGHGAAFFFTLPRASLP